MDEVYILCFARLYICLDSELLANTGVTVTRWKQVFFHFVVVLSGSSRIPVYL